MHSARPPQHHYVAICLIRNQTDRLIGSLGDVFDVGRGLIRPVEDSCHVLDQRRAGQARNAAGPVALSGPLADLASHRGETGDPLKCGQADPPPFGNDRLLPTR